MRQFKNNARCRVAVPGHGTVQPGATFAIKGSVPSGIEALAKAGVLSEVVAEVSKPEPAKAPPKLVPVPVPVPKPTKKPAEEVVVEMPAAIPDEVEPPKPKTKKGKKGSGE